MVLISFVWFVAMLFAAFALLRIIQGHVSQDSSIGHALAFVLH